MKQVNINNLKADLCTSAFWHHPQRNFTFQLLLQGEVQSTPSPTLGNVPGPKTIPTTDFKGRGGAAGVCYFCFDLGFAGFLL